MKKLLIFLAILALASLSTIALHTYSTPLKSSRQYGQGGVERVTHYDPRVNYQHMATNVYLSPLGVEDYVGAGRGGYAPLYARGSARIESSTWYGYPRSRVQIKTKDIPPSDRDMVQFEGWLVDAETGYRLSVGVFVTGFGGVGLLDYHVDNYLDPYDFVEVTKEPYGDLDVLPGEVVLVGVIPKANYFNPPAKGAKMVEPPAIKTY
ncbi:MAG: hypothetical protein QW165_03040 [Candidatus Woesearchaeota archaeon]